MKNDEGLDFALSRTTGRMVDITMVERGLACDCICPSCGATLQARKGRKNRHHFSHYVAGSAAATCEGGRESALHAAARYIIAAWRQIELPALIVRDGGLQDSLPGRTFDVVHTELPDEQSRSTFRGAGAVRPDVVLYNGQGEQVWCEVRVTHAVDDLKQARLQGYGVSTLEFDLSGRYRLGGWTLASLELALKADDAIRRWVFHVDQARLAQQLRERRLAADEHRRNQLDLQNAKQPHDPVNSPLHGEDEEREGLNLQDCGELIPHPAMGLIPKDPSKRLAFVERSYPAPRCYRLARAIAFLRHHPHGDSTCLVTFGSMGSGSRTSEYDALLSEFACSAGLSCSYFGIPESRQVRGIRCRELLDAFLTGLQAETGSANSSPSIET